MTGFGEPETGEYWRTVSTVIYSRQALVAAQTAFREHCKVTIRPSGRGKVDVLVKPINESASEPKQTLLEFWNFVLDTEAQRRLET